MNDRHIAGAALDQGQGIVRLAPNWVPRAFCIPGRRLKLHPDDYYALGANRGGIDERWFSSTVAADNGPLTPPDEGLSYIVMQDGAETPPRALARRCGRAGRGAHRPAADGRVRALAAVRQVL